MVKHASIETAKRMLRLVAMNDAKARPWKEGQIMATTEISVCSTVVVYSNLEIGIAHIPPGRLTNEVYTPENRLLTSY
jgi:hypothetical protein